MKKYFRNTMGTHFIYVAIILVALVVVLATVDFGTNTQIVQLFQFGVAFTSIILALVTLVYMFVSNAVLPSTLNELRGVTKKVTKATTELQSQLKAIPKRLKSMEGKVEEQSAMVTEALQRSATSETPTPALNVDPPVTTILDKMPISGGLGLYGATLAFEYERPMNTPEMSKAISVLSHEFMHGFLVAMSLTGVITWSRKNNKITYVHPLIIENVKKHLSIRIKEVFGDDEQTYDEYISKVAALKNYFMLPEKKSSDGNDSDDSTD